MPIYEYRCRQCETRFEHFGRTMAEANDVTCPECGSAQAEKLPSTFAVGKARSATTRGESCCGVSQPCANPKRCCA
jgi:putative FmdB family regulatory protein